MGSQTKDERRMTAYLLGRLPEAERARLEDEYFASDTKYEELNALETDLVDAFVHGRLSHGDREQFEARCLRSGRLRERVAFARQLAGTPRVPAAPALAEPRRWWRRAPAGGWWPAPAVGVAAALLVVGIGFAWWLFPPPGGPAPTQARQEPTYLPARQSTPAPPTPAPSSRPEPARPEAETGGVFALILVPGSLRSLGDGATLSVPAGANDVRIRVDHEGASYAVYRAVLRTPEGREVWSESALKPIRPGSSAVEINVPTSVLTPGDYTLTLSAGAAPSAMQDVADYTFRVSRK